MHCSVEKLIPSYIWSHTAYVQVRMKKKDYFDNWEYEKCIYFF